MKNIIKLFTLLSLAAMVLLAACGPTPPETEETEETDEGDTITLFVGPELKECTGAGPQTCMMVKENAADEYTYFYDQIEGFTYEEGYDYELRVLVTPVENPPADASSLKYSLVEVVNKTAVEQTAVSPQTAVSTDTATLDGTAWTLDSYALDGEMVQTIPGTTFAFADGQMAGMTGCNNTSAGYTTDGNIITFEMGMSTMMFCGEVENGQEDAVQANISAVATYTVDGDSLQMMDADGNVILQFSAMQPASLGDNAWTLDSYTANGELVAAAEGGVYTFTPSVGENPAQMDADTGCNNISATYTVDGQNLTFGMGISTQKSCGEAMNAQEAGIQSSLHSTTSYQMQGDSLQLTDATGTVLMQFSALEAVSLTETVWKVTRYNNGTGGAVSVLEGTELTAVFAADGTLSGNAGCNIYNTNYIATDGNLSIDPSIITTRRACAEPIVTQEGQYITALSNATTYKIVGDKLELRNDEGSLQASYIAVPATPLVGITWEAVSINSGGQVMVGVAGGARITAVFNEDGTFNGNAGCNNYFGSYETDGNNISINEQIGNTMMACMDATTSEQEALYLTALPTAVSYTISDDKLELYTADGAVAVSYTAAQVTPIADSEWKVTSHNNGHNGVVSSIIGTKMTMAFDADGGVSGSAGCNDYFGQYEAGNELLSLSNIAMTNKFCGEPEGIMEQENELFAAMATVNSYIIDGGIMTMRDENNAIAITLQVKGYIDPELLFLLENGTYSSDSAADGTVTLVDGQYQEEAAPGSASMTTVIFVDAAVGTIADEYSAAVVLATNGGGTGTFISLHLMQFENGEAVEVAVTELGDRTQINGVEINGDGDIIIDMVRHTDSDPLCCPSEEAVVSYRLVDGELMETAVPIGMPNPASVFCTENGGTLEIRTADDGGQYGMCIFEDGSECEEWDFFRGDCGLVE